MPAAGDFDRNVFINCPFDHAYRPILEAILFCVIDSELTPRIATERLDSGEVRLDKIVRLIEASRYSIHDLSRVQATTSGEFARLNMPFELGVDFGVSRRPGRYLNKRMLVIAAEPYTYQVAVSDIAGWDVRPHADDFEQAIREVRRWLASLGLTSRSASQIVSDYADCQVWNFEMLLSSGWSESDILDRQTLEQMKGMEQWVRLGRPPLFGS